MFIELKNTLEASVLININSIDSVAPFEDEAIIQFSSGKFMQVKESYLEILSVLKDGGFVQGAEAPAKRINVRDVMQRKNH